MDSDDEYVEVQKLSEILKSSVEEHPEIQKEVNFELRKLLFNLRNKNIVSGENEYNIDDSPGYQLIVNKFGKVSNNVLSNIAFQLSSQSGIPISRDITRKPVLIIKWIDCYIQQLAPFIDSFEFPDSE